MSETILFNIPEPGPNEEQAHLILWYQSVDGQVWDLIPVDTILVSNLTIDTNTGKYKWESLLADPLKFHQLKTQSEDGIENSIGYILPPRPQTIDENEQSSIIATKIKDGQEIYFPGNKIELMLNIESDILSLLDDTIDVHIIDYFNNLIEIITASKVNNSLYIAEYIVPINISKIFNPFVEEYNYEYFILKDRWIMPDSTGLEFSFKVSMDIRESAVSDNSEYELILNNIVDNDGLYTEESKIKFTSRLSPYYCDVEDVVDISPEDLSSIDRIQIAKAIISHSKNIDYTMKPDLIYYYDRYNNAVRNYLAYEIAYNLLAKNISITSESKELDTFKISKQYDYDKGLVKLIEEHLEKYGNIILAGGKDTPFTTKSFIKGIYDPNRPNLNYGSLDLSGNIPYVNKNISSYITSDADGNLYEIRGYRSIGKLK